jgi:hypothetical protein
MTETQGDAPTPSTPPTTTADATTGAEFTPESVGGSTTTEPTFAERVVHALEGLHTRVTALEQGIDTSALVTRLDKIETHLRVKGYQG